MSLSSILSIASSGLQTAQQSMNVVSDNIANVNTTGYVRKVAEQAPLVANGVGDGVTITQIARATNQFLEAASYGAAADSGKADVMSSIYDQAQSLFGDPSSSTSFFSSLDNVFAGFSTLASSPSATQASQALSQVNQFFSNASTINSGLQNLSSQADSQISTDVTQVNQLLSQIDDLNNQISRASVAGKDTTGSQNQQSQLIDQLSSLMDIRVTSGSNGAVTVRTSNGTVLAGSGAAQLRYDSTGPTGQIYITAPGGTEQALGQSLNSGELEGLLTLRNSAIPNMSAQLSELTSQVADQLNTVSNAYSSVPAPATLTGANTGLDLPTAISGFTGKTNVAIVNASGVVQQQVAIDFSAGAMTVNGSSSSFTPATFLSTLNSALGGAGTASFSNGALSISATGSGNGVAIADDTTTPSSKAGRGFSDFFGLNDLVQSSTISNYDTGLQGTDPNGFTPGQTITLRVAGPDGASIQDITVAVPSGPAMNDLLGALNAPVGGVGLYGSFSLDANGQMSFTPAAGSNLSISVVKDTTSRGANGPSMSQLFGIGDAQRATRTASFSIRSDIAQNPTALQTAQLNLSAVAGTPALAAGDTRGADALSQAGQNMVKFQAAGAAGTMSMTLSDYAASFAGSIASEAANASTTKTNADAVASEAQTRLTSAEGVNIDEELVNLTTYQQAYSASARMVQAAKDMFSTLMTMVQ